MDKGCKFLLKSLYERYTALPGSVFRLYYSVEIELLEQCYISNKPSYISKLQMRNKFCNLQQKLQLQQILPYGVLPFPAMPYGVKNAIR